METFDYLFGVSLVVLLDYVDYLAKSTEATKLSAIEDLAQSLTLTMQNQTFY